MPIDQATTRRHVQLKATKVRDKLSSREQRRRAWHSAHVLISEAADRDRRWVTGPTLRKMLSISAMTLWRWRHRKESGFPSQKASTGDCTSTGLMSRHGSITSPSPPERWQLPRRSPRGMRLGTAEFLDRTQSRSSSEHLTAYQALKISQEGRFDASVSKARCGGSHPSTESQP